MNRFEAVDRLREISKTMAHDPESAHSEADQVLFELAGPDVQRAYESVRGACRWWAYA